MTSASDAGRAGGGDAPADRAGELNASRGGQQDRPEAWPVPVTVLLAGRMEELPPSMQRLARVILADPGAAAAMTIDALSSAAQVSQSTVVRLCRELGATGFREFRLHLAAEVGRRSAGAAGPDRSGDIAQGDDLPSVIAKIAYADALAVRETAAGLSVPELRAVVEAIVTAGRTAIYGVGASGLVAIDLQLKLQRIGRVATAHSDVHLAVTDAALLHPGDVAIAISHTGMTAETVDVLRVAARRGATTVAITNAPRSTLARMADRVLTTAAHETSFRSGATASRLAQLTVIDCVFVAVAQHTYAASQAALEATHAAVRERRLTRPRSTTNPTNLEE